MPSTEAIIHLVAKDSSFNAAMRRVETRMESVRRHMEHVARAARRVFLVSSAAMAGSVAVFGSFEKQMARVRAITDASGASFEKLTRLARDLGKATVFSARQAAEAMGLLAQAGFSVAEITRALPDVLNLAAAGQLDMATAADISAKIMRGMQIDTVEFKKTVDVLAKAFTTSNTNLVELGEGMKFVGPIASNAGLSLEETVAALQALADGGFSASLGGTALRTALVKLQSAPSKKFFEGLGLSVADVNGNLKPLPELIALTQKAMDKMGGAVDQTAELMKIFGLRGGPGMQILLARGSGALQELTDRLQGAGGTADKIAKTQLDTLFGSFKILRSAAEELAISIGESLAPMVESLSGNIKSLIDRFNGMSQASRDAIVDIGLLVTGLAGLLAISTSVSLAIKSIAGTVALFAGIKGALSAAAAVVSGTGGAFASAGASATLFTKALGILKTALRFTLIGVGVAAVGALILKWRELNRQLSRYRKALEEPTEALNRLSVANRAISDSVFEGTQAQIDAFTKKAEAIDDSVAALERQNKQTLDSVGLMSAFNRSQAFAITDANDRRIAKLKKEGEEVAGTLKLLNDRLVIDEELALAAEQKADSAAAERVAKQAQADIDQKGLDVLTDLTDKLRLLRGEITQEQLELIDLENLGVGKFILEQILAKQQELSDEKKSQDRKRANEDEAASLKRMAETDAERLATQLARVDALRVAGFLTQAEASKIESSLSRDNGRSLQGQLTTADALLRRQFEASAGRAGAAAQNPAAQTAKATQATAQQSKTTVELLGKVHLTIENLLSLIRDKLSGQLVGVFG